MTVRLRRQPGLVRRTITGLGLAGLLTASWLGFHLAFVFGPLPTFADGPLTFAVVAVQCWLFTGLFIVAHDAMHGSLAPACPRLNGMVGSAILFAYAGFGWRRMRDAHFDHHRYPGTPRDPDWADDGRRFCPWYGTFLVRYFGWGSFAYLALFSAVHVAGLGADPVNLLLFHAAPSILSSLQLFAFGTYLPHRREAVGFSDRHNARSQQWHPVLSLAACFHFGYHHEHHRHPAEPWWLLPGVRTRCCKGTQV